MQMEIQSQVMEILPYWHFALMSLDVLLQITRLRLIHFFKWSFIIIYKISLFSWSIESSFVDKCYKKYCSKIFWKIVKCTMYKRRNDKQN